MTKTEDERVNRQLKAFGIDVTKKMSDEDFGNNMLKLGGMIRAKYKDKSLKELEDMGFFIIESKE